MGLRAGGCSSRKTKRRSTMLVHQAPCEGAVEELEVVVEGLEVAVEGLEVAVEGLEVEANGHESAASTKPPPARRRGNALTEAEHTCLVRH